MRAGEATSFHPDVVILDVQMPRMDGLETLERLRSRPGLPVLFLTARDAVADRVQGLRGGADDCVTKPFDLDEVAARVEALLRRVGRPAGGVDGAAGCRSDSRCGLSTMCAVAGKKSR